MFEPHVPVVVHALTVCFQLFWSLCIEVFQPIKSIKLIRLQECRLHFRQQHPKNFVIQRRYRTYRSIVQAVTASPCSRQAWGFLSLCLHSRYALLGFEHAKETCFATASSTAVVGGGELSCCDMLSEAPSQVLINGPGQAANALMRSLNPRKPFGDQAIAFH